MFITRYIGYEVASWVFFFRVTRVLVVSGRPHVCHDAPCPCATAQQHVDEMILIDRAYVAPQRDMGSSQLRKPRKDLGVFSWLYLERVDARHTVPSILRHLEATPKGY